MGDAVSVPDSRQMIIGEQHNLSFDFANTIAPGDTISNPSVTVVNQGTNEPISNALRGLPFTAGTLVNFTFTSAGLRRNTFYAVTITCTATGNNTSKTVSAVLIIEIVY